MYQLLIAQLKALTEDNPYRISNLANVTALLYDSLEQINWVGFYIMQDGKLILGPFQGKVACTQIAVGKGVCGTAVSTGETQRVDDVHLFEGHIACDSASNSELVIPVYKDGEIFGVLDIDSPIKGRFSEEDQAGLEALVKELEKVL
ncbi:MAG: GAF domain-containing protein [Lachnospiraceae bacterium]|nr:GAF domain-containing protein [Lachnospiraceae bacterium]